jgi:thioredoxin reductase
VTSTPDPSRARPDHDVIVVGGGVAGLSAALYLGRSRRHTLVVDAGRPRNAPSAAAHGVFTRDGTPPSELLAEARRQLAQYPTVRIRSAEVVGASGELGRFVVRLSDGTEATARRLLLACGVTDEVPTIDGIAERWGASVLHCAYCHGFEVADRPLATLATGPGALESVAGLLSLSRELVLCTNGPAGLSDDERGRLDSRGVSMIETALVRVSGDAGRVALHFADGSRVEVGALFVSAPLRAGSRIPLDLGCAMTGPARVTVDLEWQTSVPGVHAAGDIATARKQVAVAAASGAEAAMALNGSLSQEDFGGDWDQPLCGATPKAAEPGSLVGEEREQSQNP